jgi:hypothetical protein
MNEGDKQEDKEVDTMATIKKTVENAFVLSPQRVDAFLKQDNEKFKNAMERFKKHQKQSRHSNAK